MMQNGSEALGLTWAANCIKARKRALYDNEFMECPQRDKAASGSNHLHGLQPQGAKNSSHQY